MHVTIIGGSLAGLSAALGLVQHLNTTDNTCHVNIVERRPDFSSKGATFGLSPGGQKALSEIAGGEEILRDLKQIGIDAPLLGGGTLMLPWHAVRDALLERCEAHENISIWTGTEVEDVQQDEVDGKTIVTATLVDSTETENKKTTTLKSDVLIAADGVHSRIRTRYLGLKPPVPSGTRVWRGSINTASAPQLQYMHEKYPPGMLIPDYFGEEFLMSYFSFDPVRPGEIGWVCASKLKEHCENVKGVATINPTPGMENHVESLISKLESDEEIQTLKENLERARQVFQCSSISDLEWSTEIGVVDFRDKDANKAWAGRGCVTLIGDAAHAIRPVTGLGGTLAFEDSVVLSRHLAKTGESIPTRLRAFEEHRRARCGTISRDESMRSAIAFKFRGITHVPECDPLYKQWLFAGPDASPTPPVNPADKYAGIRNKIPDLDNVI